MAKEKPGEPRVQTVAVIDYNSMIYKQMFLVLSMWIATLIFVAADGLSLNIGAVISLLVAVAGASLTLYAKLVHMESITRNQSHTIDDIQARVQNIETVLMQKRR